MNRGARTRFYIDAAAAVAAAEALLFGSWSRGVEMGWLRIRVLGRERALLAIISRMVHQEKSAI